MFHNDMKIIISTAGSRKAITWTPQEMMWSQFVGRLDTPTRTTETFEQFKALTKAQQDELKDVGGFVGGILKDNRRKKGNLLGRRLITLDADNIAPGGTDEILKRVAALGCAAAVYSTRKHEGAAPRLRIIVPADRGMDADEYESAARKLAHMIGMQIFDPTTFDPIRMMYWQSCSIDSEYVFWYADNPFLSVDGVLAMYQDWRNVQEWPQVPGAEQIRQKGLKRQQNPFEKNGIIGAFCRVYDVPAAIAEFLPDVYDPCGNNRYTYRGGSTFGGAALYDNGAFLYSHHATDPVGGNLCNAFDLVRIHKFGHLDDEAKEGTPTEELPSFRKMITLARKDRVVKQEEARHIFQDAGAPQTGGVISFEHIEPEEVEWLWYPYIPIGKLTILAGAAGIGKTFLESELAAIISTGRPFPGEEKRREQGLVCIQNTEDGLADTIVKRLVAAGADRTKIKAIDPGKAGLFFDDPRIEEFMKKHSPVLMTFDPFQSFFGSGIDLNRSNETRPVFDRLLNLAQKYKVAVVLVMHLSKMTNQTAINRVLGSVDVVGAVRSVLIAVKHPRVEGEIVLCHEKSNLAPKGESICYQIENGRVEWTGFNSLTADDCIQAEKGKKNGGRSKLEQATQLIESRLEAIGKVSVKEVTEIATEELDISDRTLRQAKANLGLVLEKSEFSGEGFWIRP